MWIKLNQKPATKVMLLVFSKANSECIAGTVASQRLYNILCRQDLGERAVYLRSWNAGVRAVQFCVLAQPGHIAGSAVGKTAVGAADCPGFEKMTSSLLMCRAEDARLETAAELCASRT